MHGASLRALAGSTQLLAVIPDDVDGAEYRVSRTAEAVDGAYRPGQTGLGQPPATRPNRTPISTPTAQPPYTHDLNVPVPLEVPAWHTGTPCAATGAEAETTGRTSNRGAGAPVRRHGSRACPDGQAH